MNNSLVSVVMCTYNGSRFVAEQIESICRQTYTNLQIIIVDDASTDTTFEMVKQFADKDKRIQLFRNDKNLGFTLNFNKACHLATGDFIAIADQDDIWHPEKLQRMVQQWQPNVLLMYCNSVRFADDKIPRDARDNPRYRRFEGKDSRKLSIFNTISGHAILMKKNFLSLISPFPPQLMYDWYAGVVAACNGGVGYVPDILVFQRIHESNVSVGGSFDHNIKEHKKDFNKMVKDHLAAFITIPGMPAEHILFFQKLLGLWSKAMTDKFNWPLFIFLIKNRQPVFNYKKKKFALFSHIKHSYRLASN